MALRLALLALLCAPAVSDPVVERFQAYLRLPTAQPTPDYAAAAEFLRQQASEVGLTYETLTFEAGKPLVLMTWLGSDPALPSVMLNSHTDVVPAEAAFWSHPPFAAELHDGKVYARGSQDMKCVGLQYLEALRRLKASGWAPRRTLVVTFVPDEETGGVAGMEGLVASARFRELNVGLELDEGWATPGEVFPVFTAERCPWWFLIRAAGEPGHGSKLYDGGAMETLAAAVGRVMAFRAAQFDRVKRGEVAEGDAISVNLVALRGGIPRDAHAAFEEQRFHMNMQPATAEAAFDMRLPPMSRAEMEEVEALMRREWAPPSSNLSLHFVIQARRLVPSGAAAVTSTDPAVNPWWAVFTASLAAQGLRAEPTTFPAATDASYLRVLGIPSLGFSPMRRTPKLLHEHDEHLSVAAYREGIAIYERLIADLADAPAFQPHDEL